MARPTLLIWMRDATRLLALLRGFKKVSADDCEARNIGCLPVTFAVRARNSFSRVRILDHADHVPNELACVKLVVQNPISTLHVPVDRGGVPRFAPRRRDPFRVQVVSNVTRRATIHIFAKDPTHNFRFRRDDHALSCIAGHGRVTIGEAASIEALADTSCLPSSHLVSVVLAIELTDQSAKTNQDRVDNAFVNRTNLDAQKG